MAYFSDRLVEAGHVTQEQVDAALRAQAVYGGRLGTNLVELGFIDESTLQKFLAIHHGVDPLEPDATPSADALTAIPAAMCDELNVLPLRVEGEDLVVAALDPSAAKLRSRLVHAAGRSVRLVVAPEGRLFALMRETLGIERPLRYAVVMAEAARAGQADPRTAHVHSILRDGAFDAEAGRTVPEEEGLEEVLLLDEVAEPLAASPSAEPEEVIELTAVVEESATDSDLGFVDSGLEFQLVDAPEASPEVLDAHAALGSQLRPLSFQEALVALDDCDGREALAQVVLRHALWTYRRALLFTVQRGLVLGWDGLGDRVDKGLATKLMIPASAPSIFKHVQQTKRPFEGALRETPLNRLFVRILGGEWPDACRIVPFVVRGRVVGMLYADGAIGEVTAARVAELDMLASQVQRSFERFIKSKSKGKT